MVVTVGGKQYAIDGWLLGGQVPVWRFIQHDGKPMTHETFSKLPDADQRELAEHVHRYIKTTESPRR
jgi:hypothetical protein